MSKKRRNNNIIFRFVKRYHTDFSGGLFSKGFFVRWSQYLNRYKVMFKNIKIISQRIKDRLVEKMDRRKFSLRQFNKSERRNIQNKDLRKFNYRVDIVKLRPRRKRRTLFSKRLRERHKICNFASHVNTAQYKSYVNKSRSSVRLIPFFYSLFETRVDHVIFRMNLAFSASYNRQKINHKNFVINEEFIFSPSQRLNFADILSVKDPLMFFFILNKRLDLVIAKIKKGLFIQNKKKHKRTFRIGEIFMNVPSYIEVNYRIFSCMIIYIPKVRHIYYPFNFDKFKFASFGRRFV